MRNSSNTNSKIQSLVYKLIDFTIRTNDLDHRMCKKALILYLSLRQHHQNPSQPLHTVSGLFFDTCEHNVQYLGWSVRQLEAEMSGFTDYYSTVDLLINELNIEELRDFYLQFHNASLINGNKLVRYARGQLPGEILQLTQSSNGKRESKSITLQTELDISAEVFQILANLNSVTLITIQERLIDELKMLAVITDTKEVFQFEHPSSNPTFNSENLISLPPFGQRISYEGEILGVTPSDTVEKQVLDYLNPEQKPSQASFLVTGSFNFKSSKSASSIRKLLIDNNLLDEVIYLPSKLFANTAIYTVLITLNTQKHSSRVKFIDASECFTANHSCSNILNVQKVVDLRSILTDEGDENGPNAFSVTQEQIIKNDYSFHLPVYRPYEHAENATKLGDILTLYSKEKPDLNLKYRKVSIKDLNGHNTLKPQDFSECDLISHNDESFLGHAFYSKPLLIISRFLNKNLTIAYFEPLEGEAIALKGDVVAFQIPKEIIPIWLVKELISTAVSDRIKDFTFGTAMQRIDNKLLLEKVSIEIPPLRSQQESEITAAKQEILQQHFDETEIREIYRSKTLRLKKHQLTQYNAGLLNISDFLVDVVEQLDDLDPRKPFYPDEDWTLLNQLQIVKELASQLGIVTANLLNTELVDPPSDYNVVENLPNLIKSVCKVNRVTSSFILDRESFINADSGEFLLSYIDLDEEGKDESISIGDYDPIIRISENNLRDIIQNLVANAVTKEAKEIIVKASVISDPSADFSDRLYLQIEVSNNGQPLDPNFDLDRFFTEGDSMSESTGLGGFHIKSILDKTDGQLSFIKDPDLDFPVAFNLQFPISSFLSQHK